MLFDEKVDLFVQELCARRCPTWDKSILFDNITINGLCIKSEKTFSIIVEIENEDLQQIILEVKPICLTVLINI
jgi:hypothetical protein